MVILVFNKVWHRGRLMMARLRLVVATRLHTQLPSSRLRISSNTPSNLEESHEWNHFANPIRHVLSILQFWLEKCLDEPAQFKARLQFRRAHQLAKPAFKWDSPNEYDVNCTDSEVKRKFTNLAIDFLSRQGMVTLRRRRPKGTWTNTVSLQYRIWMWLNQQELAPQTRCYLMVNGAWDAKGEYNERGAR
jgi:hypothetical protein